MIHFHLDECLTKTRASVAMSVWLAWSFVVSFYDRKREVTVIECAWRAITMRFSDHLKTSEQAVATELIVYANLTDGQLLL